MASRPVFYVQKGKDGFHSAKSEVNFQYFNGLSVSQKRKCIRSLHDAFLEFHPECSMLEISSKSENELGVRLSAFNMMFTLKDGRKVSVERAYQAGKVFQKGGPYTDLLDKSSMDAKRDERLQNSGNIIGFELEGEKFGNKPMNAFYFWLYMKALQENKEWSDEILEYDAFTDIVFNPQRMLNCQAEAAAAYVAAYKNGILEKALSSYDSFLQYIFGQKKEEMGKKAVKAEEKKEEFQSAFLVGDGIIHPAFGKGEIEEIEIGDDNASLTIKFESVTKILSELWVREHCKRI